MRFIFAKYNRLGFTLIELLVVIAIIGLLLGILIPALNRTRVRARVVVCSSRVRQLVTAAVASAVEDKHSRLPRGGIHLLSAAASLASNTPRYSVYPPVTPPPAETPTEWIIDDATEMQVEEYFKIGAAAAGTPTGSGGLMAAEEVDRTGRQLHQGMLKKLFVCPEADGRGNAFESSLPMYRGKPQFRPVIVPYSIGGQSRWVVRTGYLYFGGFDTSRWPQEQTLGGFQIRPFRAPIKLSDPGNGVLITDPLWLWPEQNQLIMPHTTRGYLQTSGQIVRTSPQRAFGAASTTIGRLDGSVTYRLLRDLDIRAAYCQNGQFSTDLLTLF